MLRWLVLLPTRTRRAVPCPLRSVHQGIACAVDEGRSQSNVLLCCLALAAISSGTLSSQNEADSKSRPESPAFSAEFIIHGRRLNVLLSPWLSTIAEDGPASTNMDAAQHRRRDLTSSLATRRSAKYVIVGMGVTGSAALQALLECEPDADITVVERGTQSADFEEPQGGRDRARKKEKGGGLGGFLRRGHQGKPSVKYLWGTTVNSLDADGRILSLSDGSTLRFEKCLLAVGEGPVRVPPRYVERDIAGRVTPLHRAEDRRVLGRSVAQGHHVTVVGSNWASVELASFLSDVGRRHGWGRSSVTLVFPESTPLAKELPRYLSGLLMRRLERRGVEVIPHTSVKYIGRAMAYEVQALRPSQPWSPPFDPEEDTGEGPRRKPTANNRPTEEQEPMASFDPIRVYLTSKFASLDSTALLTDHVVVGGSSSQGRLPTFDFEGHPLEADAKTGAIVVSHELQASSSVFVAGDAAHFPCTDLGKRVNVRSADHAYHSGWVAGMNMTGRGVRYQHLPLFFGAIPRLGVRAAWVGQCDGSAETHGFWWKEGGKANGSGGTGMARKRTRMGEDAPPSTSISAEEEKGLSERVKGAFQSLLGGEKDPKGVVDNTSSALAAVGIGTTGWGGDSNTGRRVGIYRRTTTDRELGDLDAVVEAEMESEALARAGGGKNFTPVNGTGIVFFVDPDGTVRGILGWGLPPPSTAGEKGDQSESEVPSPSWSRTGGVGQIDNVLGGVIERARTAVGDGLRSGTTFKYDMNSRQDTVSALRALAFEIIGPEALEQLGPKAPLYTYNSAKLLSNTADDTLFRINNNSRSSADLMEEAYEAAVKGHMQPTPGTNTVPFPFNRS
ncbi:apoptosis inducing factor [Nannochloropsis gaditana]|uniref:Apoptosis inducing factor n=2 Tax=Nannochloropsis gaditana TaxID=72520 RepID=W7TLI7_9STRA|nr:apoptosis inducing factor [Nannochloropsis gaditana]